jgi:acyl-CoA reductase-like NAD-dependent aldehyde dehydrogenase
MAGTRILVQGSVAGAVRDRLAQLLAKVKVGPGNDPNSEMGPLIDKAAVERVDALVEAALSYAKPIVRGGPVTDGPLAAGSFYRPALLEVEDVDVPLVQEEIFAPVATFEVFDNESEAVRRATNSYFALDDGFAEGGYKSSGVGRLRGPLGLAEFQEAKTYVEVVPPTAN